MKSRRLANISHVWLVVPWLGVVLAAKRPIRDNSFLWHIEAGHRQAEAGRVLTTDPFSLSFSGQPWRTQSWLLELIYARLGNALAWVGPFVGLMSGLTLLAIGVAVHQKTRSARWTAGVIVWLELLALPYFAPRPVLVSFVFLALLVLVLRTKHLRWAIPLLMWVWASMHGSFILGGGLILLEGLAHRDRRRIMDALAAGFGVSLTAHGWHVWEIVFRFLGSSESLDQIGEWAPPDILSRQVLPFTAVVVAILWVATRGGIPTRALWVVAPFLVFGLSTSRAIMPASLVLIVYVASSNRSGRPNPSEPSVVATVFVVALIVLPLLVSFSGSSQLDPVRFPVAVSSSLLNMPTFHDDVVGGYLIFRGGDPARVLIDDRAELYSDEFIRSVVATRNGTPEWKAFFETYGIEQVLIRKADGLATALQMTPGWTEVASDDEFVVWRTANR